MKQTVHSQIRPLRVCAFPSIRKFAGPDQNKVSLNQLHRVRVCRYRSGIFFPKASPMLGFSFRHFVARERYGVLDGDGTEMGRKERRKEGRKGGWGREGRKERREGGREGKRRKEGRKEGREEGEERKEGEGREEGRRKEGRKGSCK